MYSDLVSRAKRRIGLGVTGLADALLMVGLRYGSDAAAAKRRMPRKSIWVFRSSCAIFRSEIHF